MEKDYSWLTLIYVKDSNKINDNPLNIPDFDNLNKDQFIIEALKLFDRVIEYVESTENSQITLNVNWIRNPYQVTTHGVLYNILNHLAYHRGQIAFMFKKLGVENIPETDYNPYLYELKMLV